jgi:sugar phosphate isomerase/epimerase
MGTVPITYLFDFEHCTEQIRPYIMSEFAANGAKHLVLTDTLIRMIIRSPGLANILQKEIETAGMSFVDSHAPFGIYEDLNVPDPQFRGMMLDRLKVALRIATDFGIDSIAVHTGNTREVWKNYSLEQLHEAMLSSLEVLVPFAEKLGITIAIENIWFPTNTVDKLLDAISKFPSPALGICYDSGHANLMKMDRGFAECNPLSAWENHLPVEWDSEILEKLLPFVTTCHIHDNNGQRDEHLLPGKGNIDWQKEVALLKKAPQLKCIQCETVPVRTNASIADTCKVMTKLFAC